MKEIEDILVDYFGREELSASDLARLERWLADRNNAKMVQVLEGMQGGRELREELERDPKAGMAAIRRRWRNNGRSGNWRYKLWYGGVAAAIIVFFVSFALLSEYFESGSDVYVGIVDCSSVKLKLNNGDVLPLRSGEVSEVVVRDSFTCLENENSTLICTSDKVSDEVEYHTISVPAGAEYRVILSDGTKVHLNADSELRFPSMFSEYVERCIYREKVILK